MYLLRYPSVSRHHVYRHTFPVLYHVTLFLNLYTAVLHLEYPTRCGYIRVPTTGSLMGTRWKEAPLDNLMQLARGGDSDVPTFSGPLGAGHMLCTRVGLHACRRVTRWVYVVAQRYFTCSLIGDVANSRRPLLIIPKVQLRLRVTRRSATALARYPQKWAKIVF